MFDIGGPEFLIIAVVALVVLGPERLPEVMRKVGQFYRQARDIANQYTGEAQRMFEEGMREVEDVSSTLNSTIQDATASLTAEVTAPPRLAQAPPAVQAPSSAAVAGPTTLVAWHQDTYADREPVPAEYPVSPSALPRRVVEEVPLDDFGGIGGPALMGPAPTPDELAEIEALAAGVPDDLLPPEVLASFPPVAPPAAGGAAGAGRHEPSTRREPSTEAQPARISANGKTRPASEHVLASNGVAGDAWDAGEEEGVVLDERQRTLIDLYRAGGITLEKAAEFLQMSPEFFRYCVEHVQ